MVGFGVAGLLIAVLTHELGNIKLWQAFGFFVLSATLLGWVFVAMAHLISVVVSEKSRAAGLALLVWFLFVLVFDLALLGLLVGSGGSVAADVFPYLLLLNPTDVFRLANLSGFEAAQAYSGLTSVASAGLFHPAMLMSVLLTWVLFPFGVALWLFNRRLT